eukprot:COSAG03_NODE_79_length_14054_cov_53.206951_4_plen_83_part_00
MYTLHCLGLCMSLYLFVSRHPLILQPFRSRDRFAAAQVLVRVLESSLWAHIHAVKRAVHPWRLQRWRGCANCKRRHLPRTIY